MSVLGCDRTAGDCGKYCDITANGQWANGHTETIVFTAHLSSPIR